MNKDGNGNIVNKGDVVTVNALGMTKSGTVVYADYDKWENSWDIECTDEYFHWKQCFDKGTIVSINGKQVNYGGANHG